MNARKLLSLLLTVVFMLTGFILPIAQPVYAMSAARAEAIAAESAQASQSPAQQSGSAQSTYGNITKLNGEGSGSMQSLPSYGLSGVSAASAGVPGGNTGVPADPAADLPMGSADEITENNSSVTEEQLSEARSILSSAARGAAGRVNDPASQSAVFASDRPITVNAEKELAAITDEEYEKLIAVQEMPDEEYIESLIFSQADNGSEHTVEYCLSPVRYKTETGEWEMIDPSISIRDEKGTRIIESAKSYVKVGFNESAANGGLVTMEKDGSVIAFAPVDESGSLYRGAYSVYFTDGNTKAYESENKGKTGTDYSSIIYKKAFANGTDIVYTPTGDGVKEDIVLYSAPEQTEYKFLLYTGGLVPVVTEDGTVCLVDPRPCR